MSIKFNCPHCQQVLNVKDEWAGKRARCPRCKQALTVPNPAAAGRPTADVEELAAAALAEQPAAAAPRASQATIEFPCYYCDVKVQVSADLAGKQTPCPECRRIIKVPVLEKEQPKDWRRIDLRLPAGARRDTGPVPEGAWGTHTTGVVSHEALIEAEALPEIRPSLTWQQWAGRGAATAAALACAGFVCWLVLHFLATSREHQALARALQYLDTPDKLPRPAAAKLGRAVGAYFLGANKVDEARSRWQKARADVLAAADASPNEREAMLLALALSQLDLGGSKDEVDQHIRLRWNDAQTEVRQTLENLKVPEARPEALRLVTRALVARGQGSWAPALASQFPSQEPELLAVIGLELLSAKQDQAAQALARQAVTLLARKADLPDLRPQTKLPSNLIGRALPTPDTKPAAAKPPATPAAKPAAAKPPAKAAGAKPEGPLPPSLIALLMALGDFDAVTKLAGPLPEESTTPLPALPGFVAGLARRGQWDRARALARSSGTPPERLEAWVALAALAQEDGQTDAARQDLTEAFQLADAERARPVSPWLFWRLVRLGVQAGLQEPAQRLARLIPDPAVRGRAELEVLHGRLAATQRSVEEAEADVVDKDTPARVLAWEALTRHNTRFLGAAVGRTVDGWDEALRPFGYIGVALGLQKK